MENQELKKILFISGKGGVGKSTVSTTFAKVLASQGAKVLMIDFDISLRTLDIMLGVSSVVLYDWYDIISGTCDFEDAVISGSGPDLLAAPRGNVSVTPDQVKYLTAHFEKEYDYIILDCPAGVGNVLSATLAAADLAIIISTPDNVCARSAGVAAAIVAAAGVQRRLIINRFKKSTTEFGRALTIDDVIDTTGTQLLGVVPEDMQLSLSLQNGELLDTGAKSVKAVSRIIKRLNGEYIPLKI